VTITRNVIIVVVLDLLTRHVLSRWLPHVIIGHKYDKFDIKLKIIVKMAKDKNGTLVFSNQTTCTNHLYQIKPHDINKKIDRS
jgi:hypothetical protein